MNLGGIFFQADLNGVSAAAMSAWSGRAVGLCLAIAGAGALLGGISSLVGHGEACSFLAVAGAAVLLVDCGTGAVAVLCFQFVRPRNFRK